MTPNSSLPSADEHVQSAEPFRASFALRRFPAALEAEYHQFNYQTFEQTRRAAIILLICSFFVFLALDLFLGEVGSWTQISLPVMLLRTTSLLIVLVAASQVLKYPDRVTGERWITIALISLSLGWLLITVLYYQGLEQLHIPFGLEGLILVQIAIFFPIGYSYRKSLCLGLLTLVSTCIVVPLTITAQMSSAYSISLIYLLVATVATGAAGYCQEYSMRSLFLAKRALSIMADTDGLTQLYNRRTFDLLLQRAIQEGLREHKRVAMIMFDLDHFKAYNDLYGHPAGDVALQRIAAVLASHSRRELDFAARLGGEEFALVLHDADADFLASKCESIRRQIQSELAIEHLKNPPQVMTASLGATFSQAGDTSASLYQRADQALYRAKANGRNRVEID
jgi:diguanylate cyclase (GGDEF)-like protein